MVHGSYCVRIHPNEAVEVIMKDEQKEVHTIPDKAMQHAAKTSLQKATR